MSNIYILLKAFIFDWIRISVLVFKKKYSHEKLGSDVTCLWINHSKYDRVYCEMSMINVLWAIQ